ncbi:hypothetical protein [Phenylobacterium sp.]|uniref:hypothetical protein n=1 Tax=Phenylobacterium sp. TaxID=1871053 RepID=UPI0025E2F66B|nr:hypothetical protein [Phenylobacterium sp.]MBX3482838.1 hypothetical protein [Phenylobacterium sp.]MCW5759406.1 hypothetical protein [Phenylobacterium sp.]
MRTAALALAALIATPALAEEAQATAPQAGVADQIAEYLRTSPAARIDDDGVQGVTPRDDRQVHGEVAVGIGTGGYRSLYMRSDMPIGESGRLSIAFSDTKNARWGDRFEGHRSVGADLRFGVRDAQRCDLEQMTPRPLDATFDGPAGRCARPLP